MDIARPGLARRLAMLQSHANPMDRKMPVPCGEIAGAISLTRLSSIPFIVVIFSAIPHPRLKLSHVIFKRLDPPFADGKRPPLPPPRGEMVPDLFETSTETPVNSPPGSRQKKSQEDDAARCSHSGLSRPCKAHLLVELSPSSGGFASTERGKSLWGWFNRPQPRTAVLSVACFPTGQHPQPASLCTLVSGRITLSYYEWTPLAAGCFRLPPGLIRAPGTWRCPPALHQSGWVCYSVSEIMALAAHDTHRQRGKANPRSPVSRPRC
ncbi:hypothetical protein VTK26DRAFT_1070 [Humicola hyalothermophila]